MEKQVNKLEEDKYVADFSSYNESKKLSLKKDLKAHASNYINNIYYDLKIFHLTKCEGET